MSVYDEKPWLSLYDQDQPAEIALEFTDALSMFRASVSRNPDGDIVRYFGGRITARELDELSDAFAVALAGLGVQAGDRVALYLQNVPQFVIAMLAAWKAGGIAVPVNPMNRARELDTVLRDSGARVLVCLEGLYRDVARAVVQDGGLGTAVVTTSELDYRARDDQRVFAGIERLDCEGAHDMAALIERHRGQVPADVTFGPDDTACLTYTSGTTGPPKGAMNSHGNVVFNSQAYRQWSARPGRRGPRRRAAVPHHRADRACHPVAAARRPARAGLSVRTVGDDGDHSRRAAHLHHRVDHRVHRADERAERRPGRAGLADQDLVRRRAHPPQFGQGLPSPVRAVHPQRLRPDRDDLALTPRSLQRGCARRRHLWRPVGRRPGLQHGGAHRRRRRAGPAAPSSAGRVLPWTSQPPGACTTSSCGCPTWAALSSSGDGCSTSRGPPRCAGRGVAPARPGRGDPTCTVGPGQHRRGRRQYRCPRRYRDRHLSLRSAAARLPASWSTRFPTGAPSS